MKSLMLVAMASESIRKNKLRTMLTMLGVVIGVAAVIVMVALGQGARAQIRDQIDGMGTNLIMITPGSATQGGVSQGAGAFATLTVEDAEKIEREALTLAAVSPVVSTRGQVIGGDGNWRTQIQGVDSDYPEIRAWTVESGDFFADDDVRALRKVAVIGATIAEQLFPGSDPVGQRVQIRNVMFDIVGVLSAKGEAATGGDQDDLILVPYTTAQTRLAGRGRISQILASAWSPDELVAAQEETRLIMRESHGIGSGEDDFTVRSQTELATMAESSTRVMTLLLAAIASISLLVGGIGIMNIMVVSVTERTREIGIRMAIGARGSDVLNQFLIESIVIGVLGGVAGLAVGWTGAKILAQVTGWTTVVSPLVVLGAIGFSAAIGVFFGFYPARKAAALDPIQALRYE